MRKTFDKRARTKQEMVQKCGHTHPAEEQVPHTKKREGKKKTRGGQKTVEQRGTERQGKYWA